MPEKEFLYQKHKKLWKIVIKKFDKKNLRAIKFVIIWFLFEYFCERFGGNLEES